MAACLMIAETRSGRSDINPRIASSPTPSHRYWRAIRHGCKIFVPPWPDLQARLQPIERTMTMAVELAAAEYGTGPPVAILHGLFGSGRNWRSIAQHLAARHRVLTFDLRNHGASPWADGMSYGEMVEDLRASFRTRGIDHAAVLGHSMGGKVAMLIALLHPGEIDRLVIVDIAPAANPPNLLAYIRAMRAVDLRGVKRRAEVDVMLAGSVPDPAERAFL